MWLTVGAATVASYIHHPQGLWGGSSHHPAVEVPRPALNLRRTRRPPARQRASTRTPRHLPAGPLPSRQPAPQTAAPREHRLFGGRPVWPPLCRPSALRHPVGRSLPAPRSRRRRRCGHCSQHRCRSCHRQSPARRARARPVPHAAAGSGGNIWRWRGALQQLTNDMYVVWTPLPGRPFVAMEWRSW